MTWVQSAIEPSKSPLVFLASARPRGPPVIRLQFDGLVKIRNGVVRSAFAVSDLSAIRVSFGKLGPFIDGGREIRFRAAEIVLAQSRDAPGVVENRGLARLLLDCHRIV